MSDFPKLLFDTPWLLVAVVLLPAVVWMLRRARAQQRSARLSRYAEASALRRLLSVGGSSPAARTARLVTVAMLGGLALAGPRWGLARGPTSARGIDMVVALDASLSMMATDERPTRLERMKQEVRRLRAMSRADRIALIAFAGRSYILTPLTTDDGAIELFLDNLDPSVVGQAGSSIARAIRQGTELLMASDGSADRALVIMTDGESFDTTDEVETAARESGEQGVSLVTVGFGSTEGSTIPVRDGSVTREKRDEEGKVVITRYDPRALEAAATAAGGTFIASGSSDKASRVRSALRNLRTARREVDAREDHVPRFLWAVVPALLLLMYDTWVMSRRPKRRVAAEQIMGASAHATPLTAQASIVVVATVSAMLSCTRPPDPAQLFADGNVRAALAAYRGRIADGDTTALTRYNLGTVLLAMDSLTEAAELLDGVRRSADGELRHRARFNAGLAQLLMARMTGNPDSERAFAAARGAYRALLNDRDTDGDAKWNYELALRQPPPSGGGGGGGGGNNPEDNPPQAPPQAEGALDQRQAEALLNSAAREERDVQGRKQKQGKVPPVGKDW
ncbi:MAG: VWA domain-containing protein [Gemmatimonadaceae bacterium]|nr:VWA domain-containing protein [Gemmatimonadaceae bacterium]